MSEAFDLLHPALQHHIVNSLGWPSLRPLQEQATAPIVAGEHALLLAPTAGGKTEAAFFPLLSRMLQGSWRGLSVLYVCPIRALLNNLEPRLHGYGQFVGRRAQTWHGDTPKSAKERMRADPPDVLLTTPESIEVLLTTRGGAGKAMLREVRAVVVDELHAFAGDDRGWHLLAVLERVERVAGRELQRVGLSATVGNPDELLAWLSHGSSGPRRVVAVGGGGQEPELRLDAVGTVENAAHVISKLHRGEKRLVFVDSRARVEELAAFLRGNKVQTFVSHSSLSLDERRRAEAAFAEARDCVIVATSTLELGIDVGDLDRVIQIDAPTSVASLLQRLGRTGRRPGTMRNCLFLTTKDEAFLSAAGLIQLHSEGYVEPIAPPTEPLGVFAQQVLALVLQEQGIATGDWKDWLRAWLLGAQIAHADAAAVVEHMLSEGVLHADGGVVGMGAEGERAFGAKHFLEIFSVFTSPPLFRVMHGRQELGFVHSSSFQVRADGPVVLLLAGRSWEVDHLDWPKQTAWVKPSQARGKSRWLGAGRALSFAHARAIRRVLARQAIPGIPSRRAVEALEELCEGYWWVDEEATALVRSSDQAQEWWTFAGQRANGALAYALERAGLGEARPDNLAIGVAPELDPDQLRAFLGEVDPVGTAHGIPIPQEAEEALKFARCLPPPALNRLARRELIDEGGVRAVVGDAVRSVGSV